MLNINNIHSLTDFTRNTREHIDRLKETGQAEVVVQDAQAYQKMLNGFDDADAVARIGNALQRLGSGDEGVPMRSVLEDLVKQAGFEVKNK